MCLLLISTAAQPYCTCNERLSLYMYVYKLVRYVRSHPPIPCGRPAFACPSYMYFFVAACARGVMGLCMGLM